MLWRMFPLKRAVFPLLMALFMLVAVIRPLEEGWRSDEVEEKFAYGANNVFVYRCVEGRLSLFVVCGRPAIGEQRYDFQTIGISCLNNACWGRDGRGGR